MAARIATLPGDGIGPEITAAARQLLDRVGDFELTEHPIGGASIDAHGSALTDDTLEACAGADAVLLAAVGGPKWDAAVATDPSAPRPEQGLLGIRKELGLFANLRPVRPSPALLDASPLKRDRIEGTDLLVVRELTGGIYFGDSGRDGDSAHDDCAYTVGGDRAHRTRRVPVGAHEGHQRRQGQRARDESPVARDRDARSRTRSWSFRSTTCSWTTPPCSWSRGPASST